MKKQTLVLALLAALLVPAAAVAQSNFDGTWKIDTKKSQFSNKPIVYVLQDGTFACKTCIPAYEIKADGNYHPITGSPYVDKGSIKVVSDHKLEINLEMKGKVVRHVTLALSADGNTLTSSFNDASDTNSDPVTGVMTTKRSAPGPAGSDPISGSWIRSTVKQSDNANLFTLKIDGDNIAFTQPTGQSYTAKLDGTDAPYNGDPGVTSVSAKRIGSNAIEETDKRSGKAINVTRMTLSADGKSITLAWHDYLNGHTGRDIAFKQ